MPESMSCDYVIENGIGHYQLTYNGKTCSCDAHELRETVKEMLEENN